MNIRKCFCLSMIVMISVILAPGIVSAAHIAITDDDTNGVVVTPDANFEFGFSQTQLAFKDVSFTGTWWATTGRNGSGIIYFVEPGTTTLRGILDVTFSSVPGSPWDKATINGRFEADQCGVLLSGRTIPPGFPVVEEVGGPMGVNGLFRDPATGNSVSLPSNLTISVVNDLSVMPCPVEVDIKPGSDPNSINLGSNGKVPVAILSSETFDATTVDPYSVTLAGATVAVKGKAETPMASVEDVNEDGLDDLVVHVNTQALELTEGDVIAILEGETYDGMLIVGEDTIRVVP